MIAKVEPLTTARALRGPFDYRLGTEHAAVRVGSVLVVPFARRRILAVVVEVAEHSDIDPGRLVEPLSALEADVPAELVELGLWVAREYVSTPARGLALVLPPGTGMGAGRPTAPRRSLAVAITDAGRAAAAGDGVRLTDRQHAALAALADGPLRATALARATGCDHACARRLAERGLVTLERSVEPPRRPSLRAVGARGEAGRALTEPQAAALEAVVARMDEAAPAPLLLHGVTGSGKTEIYLRAVAETLERERTAIVLVPEIALTPQTASRFVERFGDRVAILHSRLSVRERFDEWSRLRGGEAHVCVGPRSAVFAPVSHLGLLIVDEEHDGSYKQEGDPRYDARRVAERRAADAAAVLMVGSATPRPESYAAFERIELRERVDGQAMPPVELVGMAGVRGPLHERTRDALSDVRRSRGKAIVLLNRRGWSNFLACGSCGRAWECPACDVTLVLHRGGSPSGARRASAPAALLGGRGSGARRASAPAALLPGTGYVACHHCGHRERVPEACPDCGSVSVGRHGIGTEQLGDELTRLMDPLPVFRLDADSAAQKGVEAVLERFEAAASGVLIGTQMVAKGHDFPDVTLGVVLDADSTLRFPDLRAEERTFALVAQLAGRSGRGPAGGRVVVQALDPDTRSLVHAADHDADGFLEAELERREALSYPPFGHLVRVVCSSAENGPELAAAQAIRARLDSAGIPALGPAPLFRRKGRDRSQVVIKGSADARADMIVAVREAVDAVAGGTIGRGVSFAVDVDPQ